jgi:ribonuclease Y
MPQWLLIGLLLVAGVFLGGLVRWLYARIELASSEQKAIRVVNDALREAEARKREAVLETKDQLLRERDELDKELRDRRGEVQRQESRLLQKEETLEQRQEEVERQRTAQADRDQALAVREGEVAGAHDTLLKELERVSGLTTEEAKRRIIDGLEKEAHRDAQVIVTNIENDAREYAEREAREVMITAMQRLASETTSDQSVASVDLPNEDMKGRIIGREGRNIRTLENLTGVDIIIDDTPEAVILSCFDPVRKETARLALQSLITDGRIHPARIEEVVRKVHRDMDKTIVQDGEQALFDLDVHNMHPDLIMALGRCRYRTSYGQNVLNHSKEVAMLGSMIAEETGADSGLAKRACLLHDIGKVLESDSDLGHAEIGMELAKRCGEDEVVWNGIGSHHNDLEPSSLEAIIVQVADSISASRPGARRESLDSYLKRLESLEGIANAHNGVERTYAIQAGRELRVLVRNDKVSDDGAKSLGKEIAKEIEAQLKYPGRIKVTIIRETRIVEYAR